VEVWPSDPKSEGVSFMTEIMEKIARKKLLDKGMLENVIFFFVRK
jgi:hypothetical protein